MIIFILFAHKIKNMSYSQQNINSAAASIGFRIPRSSGPKCSNCGEELNTGYYGCKKCGYYDKDREEYDIKVANEEKEIDRINEAFLHHFLVKKGFDGIKGYDKFIDNEVLKHKLIVIAIRGIGVLIGLLLFWHHAAFNGIISGVGFWLIGSLYRWLKFDTSNTTGRMDCWSFLRKQNKTDTYDLIASYKKNRKKMDEGIENELYF